MATWGSSGGHCKRSVALDVCDRTEFGELAEKWVGMSFVQEKTPQCANCHL